MAGEPSATEIREELRRLGESRIFAGSGRLLAFLGFVVEETLAGRGETLKEAVIGNAVYGRTPAYDPRIDSAVRVEARRLRRKLDEYYAAEGAAATLRLDMPTGQYAVRFRPAGPRAVPPPAEGRPIFEAGRGAAIAVLPFAALSREPLDESFADSLTDELIFILGRAEGLHVASRGTTLSGRRSPAQISTELGIDAMVQGTIRRGSGRMRVTIELSNARGFVIWSDRFDAPEEELESLEERIAATVLNRVRIDSSRMRAGEIRPTPEALDAVAAIMRARQFLDAQTAEGLSRALALFERVARSAPDYSRGQSGIADCLCDMFRLGLLDHEAARERAGAAAARALAIDPSSVEAHASQATVSAWLDFDRAAAETAFRTAMGLGEGARARRIYAAFLTIRERHDEAEAIFREARALEPFSRQQDIAEATCHYQSRRFDLLREGLARRGDLPAEARFHVALADLATGSTALAGGIARSWTETALPPALRLARAELEARLGDPARARTALASAEPATRFARATLALAIGEEAQALDLLAGSIAAREVDRAWLRTDARFDRLRDTPRFQALLEAYGKSLAS